MAASYIRLGQPISTKPPQLPGWAYAPGFRTQLRLTSTRLASGERPLTLAVLRRARTAFGSRYDAEADLAVLLAGGQLAAAAARSTPDIEPGE